MSDVWNDDPATSDVARKMEIEYLMMTDRPRYFRDEGIQQEYRDILDRQAGNKTAARESAEPKMPSLDWGPAKKPTGLPDWTKNYFADTSESAAHDLLRGQGLSARPTGALAAGQPLPASPAPSSTPSIASAATSAPSRRLNGDPSQLFNQRFKGSSLDGQWNTVRAAAEKNGIPPTLAASIIAHETGNGSNVRLNNPGGLMDPKTNWLSKQKFSTIEDGIRASVATIARTYRRAGGDLDRLADIYAPRRSANDPNNLNQYWREGVGKQLKYYRDFTSIY